MVQSKNDNQIILFVSLDKEKMQIKLETINYSKSSLLSLKNSEATVYLGPC